MHFGFDYMYTSFVCVLQLNHSDVALIDQRLDQFAKWEAMAEMEDMKKIKVENLPKLFTYLKNYYGESGMYTTFSILKIISWK